MKESTTMTGVPEMNLIKGKYTLKPTKTTWLANKDQKHDGAVMFSKTFASICPEIDRSTGLIKTGLTPNLERELEEAMSLAKGSLSPYNKAFWSQHKFYVNVPAEGVEIDCDRSALDKLKYCYLKVSSKVATSSVEAMENPLCEYVLLSAEIEAKQENTKFAEKRKAYKLFEEMSFENQIDFLSVYKQGKYKVSKSSTPDFIAAAMAKVIEEAPEEFVQIYENASFKDLVFLRKCLAAGLLRLKGSTYITLGGDTLGNSFEEAVYNLTKPEFNGVKIALLAKLEAGK